MKPRGAALVAIVATLGTACSSDPALPRVRHPEVDCYKVISVHGELVDQNVLPAPSLQETLLQMISAADRGEHLCWFTTPSGKLRLEAGYHCNPHTDYLFERKNGAWTLTERRRDELAAICIQ